MLQDILKSFFSNKKPSSANAKGLEMSDSPGKNIFLILLYILIPIHLNSFKTGHTLYASGLFFIFANEIKMTILLYSGFLYSCFIQQL